MSRGFATPKGDGTLLDLSVAPGAKHTSLAGLYGDDAVKLRVSASPVEGKASAEAARYVAGILGIASSEVTAVRGASSRNKVAFVRGAETEEARKIISEHLS